MISNKEVNGYSQLRFYFNFGFTILTFIFHIALRISSVEFVALFYSHGL